jgi:hypothetical protein
VCVGSAKKKKKKKEKKERKKKEKKIMSYCKAHVLRIKETRSMRTVMLAVILDLPGFS